MSERLDVLDKNGNRTGRIVERGEGLGPGEFHRVVHVWIRNESGEYLIQKRSEKVQSFAGMWATTGGYIGSGEESQAAALRETHEEMGLKLRSSDLRKIDHCAEGHLIADVYVANVLLENVGSPELGPEVSATKWASREEIGTLMEQGAFFPYSYFDALIP